MAYTDPRNVDSPRDRWKLIDVLVDTQADGHALAIGEWDKQRVLAARWNGDGVSGVGSPQSRGLPTWFILPEWMYGALLTAPEVPTAKVALAKALLELN